MCIPAFGCSKHNAYCSLNTEFFHVFSGGILRDFTRIKKNICYFISKLFRTRSIIFYQESMRHGGISPSSLERRRKFVSAFDETSIRKRHTKLASVLRHFRMVAMYATARGLS
ncbi:MAG: hypothetical protein ACJAWS_001841 [Oleiphilaceae bacterium]